MAKVNRSDLRAALKTGDHLAGLEALRDQIANDIDACGSSAFRDKAVLYYRLIGVLLEIEALRPNRAGAGCGGSDPCSAGWASVAG